MFKRILQLLLIIGLSAIPLQGYSEPPKEPGIELILSWEPLPDRTVVINFEGVSFRHNIIEHKPANGCKSAVVNEDGTITLLTHIGNNAYQYILTVSPEFYRIGTNNWEWAGERTGQEYAKW